MYLFVAGASLAEARRQHYLMRVARDQCPPPTARLTGPLLVT
jgi:hypothetical protein